MTTTARAEPAEDAAQREAAERTSRRARWFARLTASPRLIVGACAATAGLWAVIGSRLLFPYMSNNHDEPVYLLHANALEHRRLFPRAPLNPEAFLPWLSVRQGHDFVPKYAPVFPAMLAVGKWLFTSERVALGLIAAAVVVMTYLLATEILEDRRQAALAGVFMLLTPLFIIQSATFLPYSAGLLLLSTFAFALLRGERVGGSWWFVLAGLSLGLAFFARPYDAVLFAVPLAGYVIVRSHKDLRALLNRVGLVFLGVVPPALTMGLFNRAATGSVSKSPYSILDSRDTLGFGKRAMDPTDDPMRFTPRLALTGLTHHLVLSVFWCFGGVVLVGLAVLFVSRHGWRGRPAWFGAIAVTLPTGYFFFWGTYGATRWGAPDYLGPYYYMPIFAPLIILGAGGFAYLVRAYGKPAKWALACMLVLSVFVTGQAVAKNQTFTADDRRLNTALDNADLHNALVFLPIADGPRILHPFATRRNNWNVTNDVIYAVDRSPGQNASVAADFSNRKLYELEIKGHHRGQPIDPNLTSVLHELTIMRGKAIDITLDFRNPVNRRVMTVSVTENGRTSKYVIDRNSRKGKRQQFALSLTPTSSRVTTPATKRSSLVSTPADELLLQINVEDKDGAPEALYFQRWGIARRGNGVNLLMPGQVLTVYDIPPPVLTPH